LGASIENSMRDGLYKNLPLPRRWQAVLRSCTLDAERGTIAREKVERAIGQDLQREIQPPFMRAFREEADRAESLLPGFRVFGEVTSRDLGGQNTLASGGMAHLHRGTKE
jgi:hypothetical protein